LRGVFHALPFLIQKNLETSDESPIDVRGKRVAVLGGGDTAMGLFAHGDSLRCE
jgi:NADPH-dependent glutamate synthase beta subunit-like oxidoreductase